MFYSYQYNDEVILKAKVRSVKEIVTPNSITSLDSLEVLGYVYDKDTDEAYIVETDVDGKPVIENGKAKKDASKLSQKININKV